MDIQNLTKKIPYYRVLKIFCNIHDLTYVDSFLGFIEKDFSIVVTENYTRNELINAGYEKIKLTDEYVIKYEELDYKNIEENNFDISANFYSECDDHMFSFASIPAYNKYEIELYLLVIRYKFDEKIYVSYGIGYKGVDPTNPDNWMMYNNYNGKWEEVTYVYQKANVLCWYQLLPPEDF